MTDFVKFKKALQENFKEISEDVNHLFEIELDKDELWSLYLDSFPEGTNKIFRQRREHDCSCCRQFIKNFGNVVVIKNNEIKTIWDFEIDSKTYQPVINALSNYIKSKNISNIYVTKFKKIGTDKNYEKTESEKIIEWQHFYLELPIGLSIKVINQ